MLLRWQGLLTSAIAMLPLVALLAVVLGADPALTVAGVVIGSAAALVQVLGLVRWPFAIPELARRYVSADGPQPPQRGRRSRSSSPRSTDCSAWASASTSGIC